MVVDASVSLAWFFEDEATPFTESALSRLASEAAWVLTLDAKLLAAARAAHHPVETGLSG